MLTHIGTVTLSTPRLTLRRMTIYDAEDMYYWAKDPAVSKYLSWNPHESVDATRELLVKWTAQYDNIEYYHWGIEYEGTLIGTYGLNGVNTGHERCEMGYCIGVKWWNNGFVTEAAGSVIRFAFEELGANKVIALYDTNNIGSGRVMQKNGMKQEGLLREQNVRKDGTHGDVAYYAILKSEWSDKLCQTL